MIGRKVRQARKKQKMSLREFGDALGVSAQTISAWERGEWKPSYRFVVEAMIRHQDWRRDWASDILDIYLDPVVEK